MRHRKAGIKLGRTGSHRNAMFRNMVTSLLKHGRIHTTDAKAKELRRWSDHVITLAKRGDLHARRQALAIVNDKAVVHSLFEKATEQFGGRPGGYTRLIKTGRRAGDAAPMTIVELVTEEVRAKTAEKAPGKKPEAAPARPVAASGVPQEVLADSSASDSEPEGRSQKDREEMDDSPAAAPSDDASTEAEEAAEAETDMAGKAAEDDSADDHTQADDADPPRTD